MKWQAKEIDLYLQAKEYVDTAIIPLVPISLEDDFKKTIQVGEFIALFCDELEKQFKGRVFQFPPYTYIKKQNLYGCLEKLIELETYLKKYGFRHVIYLTSDSTWEQTESSITQLIYISAISLEELDKKQITNELSKQVKQLLPMLMNKWQNES
ncbi:hypothetical protein BKP37_07400 [Anaerobacillus alkalilacustris]|uniref:DUF2487 domain-containing protein n=1 Tax=Anaerobacillus alkalilacustris TaxID=393763 RepID=A0A1S2LTV4_9BACI|nr:DUF2487 family protein [Anaerobacillus alkalilacustris]OIJ14795.1 hypothetical protein BKP37_07400 [Anaerobacillus alkalilacustris]